MNVSSGISNSKAEDKAGYSSVTTTTTLPIIFRLFVPFTQSNPKGGLSHYTFLLLFLLFNFCLVLVFSLPASSVALS